jgi:hypothetical protein
MRKILIILACSFATIVSAQTTIVNDGTPSGTAVGSHAIINQGTIVAPTVPKVPATQQSNSSTRTSQGIPVNQPRKPIAIPQKKPIAVPKKGSATQE